MVRNGTELDDVKFTAKRRPYGYSSCEACFAVGDVVVITYPTTCYHDGKHLSTMYLEKWLCDDCLRKLKTALNGITENTT